MKTGKIFLNILYCPIFYTVLALIAIRDRHIEARRQQRQQTDSGHGTSVNDSESEPDSLNGSILNLPQNQPVDGQLTSEDSSSSLEADEGVPGLSLIPNEKFVT